MALALTGSSASAGTATARGDEGRAAGPDTDLPEVDVCAPVGQTRAMRHGWYMVRTDTEHGDPVFSAEARSIWQQRRRLREEVIREVREAPESEPDRPNQVSIFQQQGCEVVRYLILRDET
jgi:hypothetical protein